ncbi:unannotated protein [freshwater metagenome]|uniref:Unannotated protein n=1 Tax=freshwater metagenome TaxID=449393 RepID=A0A6J7CIJ8_9ZZZZ
MSTDPAATPFNFDGPPAAPEAPATVERPPLGARPEILIGAAAASGFILAKILGRVRGR